MLQPDGQNPAPELTGDSACLLEGFRLDDDSTFFAKAAVSLGTAMEISRGEQVPLPANRDMIVFVLSGATKLIAKASRDREQIVAFHFQNDLVSIAAPDMHVYSLEALCETKVLVFSARALIDASEADPLFMKSVLKRTLISLYRCRDKALGLGRKSAQERLASFFVAMAERIGTVDAGKCHLELPMSRGDIADSLGLTIETVSRQFSELRCAKLIETDGRSGVTLLDIPALADRTGHF